MRQDGERGYFGGGHVGEYWSIGRHRNPKTARPGARIDALTRSPCCSAESAGTSVSNRKEGIQYQLTAFCLLQVSIRKKKK